MIWKTVKDFPKYEVSETGLLRREGKNVGGSLDRHGYRKYALCDGRARTKRMLAHRLVAETFIGDAPDGKPLVAHRNGIRRCNHVSNLYWASYQDNSDDMQRHGTQRKGRSCHSAKLTEEEVREIRASPEFITKLCVRYGVSNAMISKIKRRVSWKHVT